MREQIAQQPPLKRRASAQRRTEYPASPHHAGHYAGLHPEDMPFQSSQLTRGQYPQEEDDEEPDDSYYPQRAPLSNRRYRSTDVQEIVRGNRRLVIHNEPPPSKKRHVHPLLIGGVVAAVIVAGVILPSLTSRSMVDKPAKHLEIRLSANLPDRCSCRA